MRTPSSVIGGSCCCSWLFLLLLCFCPLNNNSIVAARRLKETETTSNNARIVGGSNADPTQYPYYTLLQIETATGAIYQCGGTLIAPDMVLSAAHCLFNKGFVTGISAIVNCTQDVNELGRTGYDYPRRSVLEIKHASYNSRTNVNDILLLQLDSPVLDVVPLAWATTTDDDTDAAQSLTVIGMGVESYEAQVTPLHLQVASLQPISYSVCNAAYSGAVFDTRMVCAAAPGKDSCFGDSGGPLIQDDTLVGITSWGKGCAEDNYPSVYTRVSHYDTWIQARVCTVSDFPPTACPGVAALLPGEEPTMAPTIAPTTLKPTIQLTMKPTMAPTLKPQSVPLIQCFSGDMIVTLRDKGPIQMKDLRIGDYVLVAPQRYEIVYSFGHYLEANASLVDDDYLELEPSGLQLSLNHMVFRSNDKKEETAVPASMIRVGDVLLDGLVGDHHRVAVTTISRVPSNRGMYAPLTASGRIVVNGVVCSTYISFQDDSSTLLIGAKQQPFPSFSTGLSFQWLCHVFELPHRLWCQYWQNEEEQYNEHGIATSVVPQLKFFTWIFEHNHVWLQILLLIPLVTTAVALHLLERLMLDPLAVTATTTLLLMLVGISSVRTITTQKRPPARDDPQSR